MKREPRSERLVIEFQVRVGEEDSAELDGVETHAPLREPSALSPKRVREHDEQPVALELEIGIEVEQIIACIGFTADQLTPGARR